MSDRTRRIGEIAAATGMTVRTLHYYEEIGLIEPTERTGAGHRLYGQAALEQLYRIAELRRLGLPLDGIRAALARRDDLTDVLRAHVADLDEQLATTHRLHGRLLRLLAEASNNDSTAGADLLDVLEDMTMLQTNLNRRISILVYSDIEAAHDELIRMFGFGPGEIMRDPDGNAVHAEIHAGDGEFWLHTESEEFGLKSPANLGGASATMAVMVDDVDEHHRHAVEQGATIRYAPVDQPYGYREYSAVDSEGHLWSFMKPLG